MADVSTWALIVVSVAGALVLPVVTARRVTPELLDEHVMLWKPGRAITIATITLVLLFVACVGAALGAIVHPFLWATVVLLASAFASTVLYLARYRSAARRLADGGR